MSRSDTIRIVKKSEKPPTLNRKTGRIVVARADAEALRAFLLSADLHAVILRGEYDPCEIRFTGTSDLSQVENLIRLWHQAVRHLGNIEATASGRHRRSSRS
jgi:hypothetical protein